MEDTVEKSCWGVALKAVIGFAVVMAAVWLAGGETTAVLATAAG